MRFCVLGSGSRGNSTVVAHSKGVLLLDAGLSCRAVENRLREAAGIPLEDVEGILISHEHADHARGLDVLLRRCRAPVYCNRETFNALQSIWPRLERSRFRLFSTGREFEAAGFRLFPFSVSHDAMDPVGFRIENGDARLAVVTDLGRPTHLVAEHVRGCDAVILEFNHEPEMLQESPRPWSLKQRVLGSQGHLSNGQGAALLQAALSPRLRWAVLAHLSAECNDPETALDYAREALRRRSGNGIRLLVADQRTPTDPVNLAG